MAPYLQDQDLEGILPTTNPSELGGIFPGSLNMNIDPPKTGTSAGNIPPPPPPPPIYTYCMGKPRINLRLSPAYQKQKARNQAEKKKQKEDTPIDQGKENTNNTNSNRNNIKNQLALMVFDQKNFTISDHNPQL